MVDSARMTFVDAVAAGFRQWRELSGRASRRLFWFWFLFTFLVSTVVLTFDAVVLPVSAVDIPDDLSTITSAQMRALLDATISDTVWSFSTLVSLALFIPTLSVTVRRFRDAGAPTLLAWATQLINPVSTVVVYVLAYSMADSIDLLESNSVPESLALQVLAMLGIVLVNIAAFVMWIVIAVRPSRPIGTA